MVVRSDAQLGAHGKTVWQSAGSGAAGGQLLDRVVILHEGHLRRLLREYVDYYSEDRCHLALEKDAPDLR